LLAHGRWFSLGTPASSTTKTGHHDIAEILLKVTLNTKNQFKSNQIKFHLSYFKCVCKFHFQLYENLSCNQIKSPLSDIFKVLLVCKLFLLSKCHFVTFSCPEFHEILVVGRQATINQSED
jgi:hypothetical protein